MARMSRYLPELVPLVQAEARRIGMDPVDLMTIISYETGGTFDPWQRGPTTKWGQHRGLIQMGGPQRKQFGYHKDTPLSGKVRAVGDYFLRRGWRPGMSFADAYSIVNAGSPGRYKASDAAAGGAPGTVMDKVKSKQMAAHRRKAERAFKSNGGVVGSAPASPSVSAKTSKATGKGAPIPTSKPTGSSGGTKPISHLYDRNTMSPQEELDRLARKYGGGKAGPGGGGGAPIKTPPVPRRRPAPRAPIGREPSVPTVPGRDRSPGYRFGAGAHPAERDEEPGARMAAFGSGDPSGLPRRPGPPGMTPFDPREPRGPAADTQDPAQFRHKDYPNTFFEPRRKEGPSQREIMEDFLRRKRLHIQPGLPGDAGEMPAGPPERPPVRTRPSVRPDIGTPTPFERMKRRRAAIGDHHERLHRADERRADYMTPRGGDKEPVQTRFRKDVSKFLFGDPEERARRGRAIPPGQYGDAGEMPPWPAGGGIDEEFETAKVPPVGSKKSDRVKPSAGPSSGAGGAGDGGTPTLDPNNPHVRAAEMQKKHFGDRPDRIIRHGGGGHYYHEDRQNPGEVIRPMGQYGEDGNPTGGDMFLDAAGNMFSGFGGGGGGFFNSLALDR